jgi:hypothetical protein
VAKTSGKTVTCDLRDWLVAVAVVSRAVALAQATKAEGSRSMNER